MRTASRSRSFVAGIAPAWSQHKNAQTDMTSKVCRSKRTVGRGPLAVRRLLIRQVGVCRDVTRLLQAVLVVLCRLEVAKVGVEAAVDREMVRRLICTTQQGKQRQEPDGLADGPGFGGSQPRWPLPTMCVEKPACLSFAGSSVNCSAARIPPRHTTQSLGQGEMKGAGGFCGGARR